MLNPNNRFTFLVIHLFGAGLLKVDQLRPINQFLGEKNSLPPGQFHIQKDCSPFIAGNRYF